MTGTWLLCSPSSRIRLTIAVSIFSSWARVSTGRERPASTSPIKSLFMAALFSFGRKVIFYSRIPLFVLRIKEISLLGFKNYPQASFRFTERIIGICGNNGVGKTNLLDALYYLCFTKSYFTRSDQQNVQKGAAGFRVEGHFEKEGQITDIVCILRETG